jgi:imidazoleglycerol-phosphate dehydratase/histidinol-phosphatase
MKRVLFIDRDGTLIIEPPDEQVDSLEKLDYYPGVFTWLGKIARECPYSLVMVTNQDGLGTDRFPEANFRPVHERMMRTLAAEGITFDDVHIDRSLPEENLPTRKPGTGMLTAYFSGAYDLANSFVIGDRLTDVELAKNLGARAFLLNDGSLRQALVDRGLDQYCALVTPSWQDIYEYLVLPPRTAHIRRTTRETDIDVTVGLDGTGTSTISTGIGFFDHMLDPHHLGYSTGIGRSLREGAGRQTGSCPLRILSSNGRLPRAGCDRLWRSPLARVGCNIQKGKDR